VVKGVVRRRIVWGTALVLLLGAGGFAGWMALVRAGVLRYNKWDRREHEPGRVRDRLALAERDPKRA